MERRLGNLERQLFAYAQFGAIALTLIKVADARLGDTQETTTGRA